MAEINVAKTGDSAKRKQLSTRVDLTPMVDLGFLLITFFIFTTTIASPTAMKLNLPDDSPVKDRVTASADKTLTLILASEQDVFYYQGFLNNNIQKTNYSASGIRVVLKRMLDDVAHKFGDRHATPIIIKPGDKASFKNVVDVLDEMLINDVTRYVLVEPDVNELASLN